MGFDEMPNNRQPKPGASRFPVTAAVCPVKALEYSWQVLRGDSGSAVGNGDLHAATDGRRLHDDRAALRVSNRVFEQVAQDLHECCSVGVDVTRARIDVRFQSDLFSGGRGSQASQNILNRAGDFDKLRNWNPAARLDPG